MNKFTFFSVMATPYVNEIDEETYTDVKCASQLQGHLAKLQKDGLLCDIDITVEGQHYLLHKCVLASSSQYFNTMFLGNFREQEYDTIELKDIKNHAFEQIVKYMYVGDIDITSKTVSDIYGASDLLQYETIKQYCVGFMLTYMKPATCLDYLEMAQRHSLDTLANSAEDCIMRNISEVAKLVKFSELSYEILSKILQSDDLYCEKESIVLDVLCTWLTQNAEITPEKKNVLVEYVRFGLFTTEEVKSLKGHEDILGTEICDAMAAKVLEFWMKPIMQPLCEGKFRQPRGHPCLIVIGGVGNKPKPFGSMNSDVLGMDLEDSGVGLCGLTPMAAGRAAAACVKCGHFLYVTGGLSVRTKTGVGGEFQEKVEDTLFRLDILSKHWTQMSPMSSRRQHHGAALVGNAIYAVGGLTTSHNSSALNTVEKYDIGADTWGKSKSFPHFIHRMAVCEFQDQLYACGGEVESVIAHMGGSQLSDSLHVLDMHANIWIRKGSMLAKRCRHGMCADSNRIYVIGGQSQDKMAVSTVETYEPKTCQFTNLTTVPQCRYFSPTVFFQGRIYVVGGWQQTGEEVVRCASIMVFDMETGEWDFLDVSLPQAVSSCGAVIMTLPHRYLVG